MQKTTGKFPVETAMAILKNCLAKNVSITESCKEFGVNEGYVRKVRNYYKNDYRIADIDSMIKQIKTSHGDVNNINYHQVINYIPNETSYNAESFKFSQTEPKKATLDATGQNHVKTLEELLKQAEVDQTIWHVKKHDINKWDVTNKVGQVYQNWQVKAYLERKRTETEETEWKDFLNIIAGYAPTPIRFKKLNNDKKYLLEISIPDLHCGKMSWKPESGESYDTSEAMYRANTAIDSFIEEIWHRKDEIGEILLPIGNDLINIDNKRNETTAGTPQSVDSRWQKMFLKAKQLFIENIDKLLNIAPVRVVMVSGNHDEQTIFYLGEALSAWYRLNPNVTIDNSPSQRKYVEFGSNMIMFTHGSEEKHQDLGLIAATENAEMWARTKFREVHLGHLHKRKETRYVSIDEFQGFKVKILPSLSGTDSWHAGKGYMSGKSAMAFLYHIDEGPRAEYIFNLN